MSKYKLLTIFLLLITALYFTSSVSAASSLSSRLQGYILLQVESLGEAWYVIPKDQTRVYMPNGSSAYQIMRYLSLGITNADLSKIPVGIEPRFNDQDQDKDGLSDNLEKGLGTDPNKADTDNDSFSDGEELKNNFNPLGASKLTYNTTLTNRLKGYILLQVEKQGQAWYLNPSDGKRYYMKDGDAAYQIMRFLSLGITNQNLNQIRVSTRTFSVNTNPPGNNTTPTPTTPTSTSTSTPPVTPPVTPPSSGGGGGGGGGTTPPSDTQSPTIPTNLSATPSGTQIALTWTASSDNVGVAGYQILRSTTNGTGYTQIATSNTNSYTNIGLTTGITYYYIVRAYDAVNNISNNSVQAYATVPIPLDTQSPTTPGTLTATVDGTQIVLSWIASTDNIGVSQYLVERSTSSISNFSQIATSTTAVYTDANLNQSTTYYYRIRASDAAGNISAYSSTTQATTATDTPTPDTTAPSTPTNLSATASGTQIALTWTASTDNTGVSGYQILRSTTNGTGYTQIATSNTNSYTNTGLSYSTTYYYVVRAYDAASNTSANSTQAQATTGSAPVAGSPAISSLSSATLVDGQSYTISGSGFGVKNPVNPYLWDQVNNQQAYQSLGISHNQIVPTRASGCVDCPWGDQIPLSWGDPIRYWTTAPRTANGATYHGTETSFLRGTDLGLDSPNILYINWWFRANVNITSSNKLIRVWPDNTGLTGRISWTTMHMTYDQDFDHDGIRDEDEGIVAQADWANWGGITDQWNNLEIIVDGRNNLSTGYGIVQTRTNNNVTHDVLNWGLHPYNYIDVFGLDCVYPIIGMNFDFTDVYMDTTLARIEIRNSPNYDTSTHTEIQIPHTTWNDGAIQFTANKGTFSTEQLYLFVVDEDGNISSGYPISF